MADHASVRGITVEIDLTPAVTASTYAVSKVMGGLLHFQQNASNPASVYTMLPGQTFGGVLESISVRFKGSVQTVGFWVFIFQARPTGTFVDGQMAAIAPTDTPQLEGAYHLTTPVSLLGTHTIYNLDGIGKAFQGVASDLWAVVVPDATTASLGSTSDMMVTLGILWG